MIDSFFWKLTFILDLNTQNWSQLVRQNVFKSRLIQDGLSVRRNVAVSLFATRDTPSAVSLCTDQKNIQLLKEAAHRNTCTGVTSHANVLSFAVGYFLIRSKSGTKKREDFLRPLLQKATSLIWKRMSDGKQELVVQHLAFWSKAAMTSKHSQHWQSWQAAWRAGTGKGQSQTAKWKKNVTRSFLTVCQYRPSSSWASFESKDYSEQISIVHDFTMKIFSTVKD